MSHISAGDLVVLSCGHGDDLPLVLIGICDSPAQTAELHTLCVALNDTDLTQRVSISSYNTAIASQYVCARAPEIAQ